MPGWRLTPPLSLNLPRQPDRFPEFIIDIASAGAVLCNRSNSESICINPERRTFSPRSRGGEGERDERPPIHVLRLYPPLGVVAVRWRGSVVRAVRPSNDAAC